MKARRTKKDLQEAAKRHFQLQPNYNTMIATSDGMWFTDDQRNLADQYAKANGLEKFDFTRDEVEGKKKAKSTKSTKK